MSEQYDRYHGHEKRSAADPDYMQRVYGEKKIILESKTTKEFSDDFNEALRLLWFFLPDKEPDPHSNKATDKERNKRWHKACEIYHKYAGQL